MKMKMKSYIILACLLLAGAAEARLSERAANNLNDPRTIAGTLQGMMITSVEVTNIMNVVKSGSMDVEDMLVDAALAAKNYKAFNEGYGSLPIELLEPKNQAKVKKSIVAVFKKKQQDLNEYALVSTEQILSINSIVDLTDAPEVMKEIKTEFKDRPAYVKYLEDKIYSKRVATKTKLGFYESPDVGTDDIVKLMLAPEPMPHKDMVALLDMFKKKVEMLARKKLALEKKTFTTKPGGVNPLVAPVKKVLDTLDNPSATGLEAALAELGYTMPVVDRTEFNKVVSEWHIKIRDGQIYGAEVQPKLMKVALFLGFAEYNKFVDIYNYN